MSARTLHHRVSRWLAIGALASYALAALLGEGLHRLMPCAADAVAQLTSGCSCCHECEAAAADLASYSETSDSASGQRAEARHDPTHCSLCLWLAKIKVGHAELANSDELIASVWGQTISGEIRLPADLILYSAARAPPHSC